MAPQPKAYYAFGGWRVYGWFEARNDTAAKIVVELILNKKGVKL